MENAFTCTHFHNNNFHLCILLGYRPECKKARHQNSAWTSEYGVGSVSKSGWCLSALAMAVGFSKSTFTNARQQTIGHVHATHRSTARRRGDNQASCYRPLPSALVHPNKWCAILAKLIRVIETCKTLPSHSRCCMFSSDLYTFRIIFLDCS